MLAWLMRGGWVTQLCTFAYVVVWPEILYEVEYELEAEELRMLQEEASKREKDKEKQKQKEREQPNTDQDNEKGKEQDKDEKPQKHQQQQLEEHAQRGVWEHESDNRDRRFFHHRPSSPAGSSSTIRVGNSSLSGSTTALDLLSASNTSLSADSLGPAPSSSVLFPQPLTPSPSSPTDASPSHSHSHTYQQNTPSHSEPPSASASPPTTGQTQGERFALAARLSRIADKEAQAAYERSAAFARKPQPVATEHPSLNTSPHLAHLSPYIIVDARRATGKDSLYLSAIGRRFSDPKVRAAWPVFWKYFNGHAALERIILGLNGDGGGVGAGSGGADKMKIKKRKEAWGLMTSMSEHLICIRHF